MNRSLEYIFDTERKVIAFLVKDDYDIITISSIIAGSIQSFINPDKSSFIDEESRKRIKSLKSLLNPVLSTFGVNLEQDLGLASISKLIKQLLDESNGRVVMEIDNGWKVVIQRI